MPVNRIGAPCEYCGALVPANGGTLARRAGRWAAAHLACAAARGPAVDEVRIGERTFTRNRRGRCEDAPCCGCCTI